MSLVDIKGIYEELSEINKSFVRDEITKLRPDPNTNEADWEEVKERLFQDTCCLTVSILGESDQRMYGENAGIFEGGNLPNPIRTVYFNNLTAWRRNASNSDPRNRIEVLLDFSKPQLLDPNPILSEPTPNESRVTLCAADMTYYHAVRQVIDTKLLNRRTRYAPIHRSFVYDAGLWLIALPLGLIVASHYRDQWFPVGGHLEAYRWAFFLYALGVVVLGYRLLNGYVKWAFPVNVLSDNKDKSLQHRIVLGAIVLWLVYKFADTIYTLLPFTF